MKRRPHTARLVTPAAAGVLAICLLGALGYAAFIAFTGGRMAQPGLPAATDELREPTGAGVAALPAPTAEQQQIDETIAALIDKLEAAIAQGASNSQLKENPYAILDQIAALESGASLQGLNLVIGMRKRFAARALSAAAAGRSEEADRLDLFSRLQPVNAAPTARWAESELTAGIAQDLPALAPVRAVLNVARGGKAEGEKRAMEVMHALAAAGVEVATAASADTAAATPAVGYYFRSDRDAAGRISRELAPLLGAVDPVALRIRGSVPPPGTIEVTIP